MPEAISADRLAEEAIELLAPVAASASVALQLQVEPELGAVWADESRIVQVLVNLIGNALKFTPEGGEVRVTAERTVTGVLFAVTDNGPGIAPDQLTHVFDRFWQARSTDRSGAGLGLAIAKGIVEAHGGKLTVASEVGAGSTFIFTVPSSLIRGSA